MRQFWRGSSERPLPSAAVTVQKQIGLENIDRSEPKPDINGGATKRRVAVGAKAVRAMAATPGQPGQCASGGHEQP